MFKEDHQQSCLFFGFFVVVVFYLIFLGLKKYTNYKMRVAASTVIGESALSEENDIFVRTPEDGKYIVCNDDLFFYIKEVWAHT